MAVNREDGTKRRFETDALAFVERHAQLEELGIRIDLCRQQEGDVENTGTFRKALAKTFFSVNE